MIFAPVPTSATITRFIVRNWFGHKAPNSTQWAIPLGVGIFSVGNPHMRLISTPPNGILARIE